MSQHVTLCHALTWLCCGPGALYRCRRSRQPCHTHCSRTSVSVLNIIIMVIITGHCHQVSGALWSHVGHEKATPALRPSLLLSVRSWVQCCESHVGNILCQGSILMNGYQSSQKRHVYNKAIKFLATNMQLQCTDIAIHSALTITTSRSIHIVFTYPSSLFTITRRYYFVCAVFYHIE